VTRAIDVIEMMAHQPVPGALQGFPCLEMGVRNVRVVDWHEALQRAAEATGQLHTQLQRGWRSRMRIDADDDSAGIAHCSPLGTLVRPARGRAGYFQCHAGVILIRYLLLHHALPVPFELSANGSLPCL